MKEPTDLQLLLTCQETNVCMAYQLKQSLFANTQYTFHPPLVDLLAHGLQVNSAPGLLVRHIKYAFPACTHTICLNLTADVQYIHRMTTDKVYPWSSSRHTVHL